MIWLALPVALLGWLWGMGAMLGRAQGSALPHRLLTKLEVTWLALMGALPLLTIGLAAFQTFSTGTTPLWFTLVLVAGSAAAVTTWISRLIIGRRDQLARQSVVVSPTEQVWRTLFADPGEPHLARFCRAVPGNEIDACVWTTFDLRHDHLPAPLDGFRIVHLTDLHYQSRLQPGRLDAILDRVNELRPDLIAITGDLVEHDEDIDGLVERLGRLTARRGVAFVLGNHDARLADASRLRQGLTAAGLWDLGGTWRSLPGCDPAVALVGHEGPWLDPPPPRPNPADAIAPASHVSGSANGEGASGVFASRPPRMSAHASVSNGTGPRPFTIGLFHTPDRIGWGLQHGVDLILAGHTHGGQVNLPWLGPVFVPSLYGSRYAEGIFTQDETVMLVGRGLGHQIPLRLGAMPEVSVVTLRKPTVDCWDESATTVRAVGTWQSGAIPAVSRIEGVSNSNP